jgi:hypothetical protein
MSKMPNQLNLLLSNLSSHLLHGLSNNKATGIDKISSKIIKLAAPVISNSLTLIFNQAITLSSFPDEWKVARVMPLYKNGHNLVPRACDPREGT